jgi:tetratricopeptide (TPR) repeat protein
MQDRYERIALEFEAAVYESGRKFFPGNPKILDALAASHAVLGQPAKALSVLDELIALEPHHPRYLYNRACALSCLGLAQEALDALDLTVRCGFDDFDYLVRDPDLAPLRGHPGFAEYRKRAAMQRARNFASAE